MQRRTMNSSTVLLSVLFLLLSKIGAADIVYSVAPVDSRQCNLLTSRFSFNDCLNAECGGSGGSGPGFIECAEDCYAQDVASAEKAAQRRKAEKIAQCIRKEEQRVLSQKAEAISRSSLNVLGLPTKGIHEKRRQCKISELRIPSVDSIMISVTIGSESFISIHKAPGYYVDAFPDTLSITGRGAAEIEADLSQLNAIINHGSPLLHCLTSRDGCLNTQHFYFKRCYAKHKHQVGGPARCYSAAAQMFDDHCWSHCESYLCTESCGDAFKHKCIKIFGTRINCGDLDRCREKCHRKCRN